MLKKHGTNLSIVLMVVIALCLAFILTAIMSDSISMTASMMERESETASNAFLTAIQNYQDEALKRAEMIAGSVDIVAAIESGDIDRLSRALKNYSAGLDLITLCDASGTVLARTHSDSKGDNVSSQEAISVALSTGKGISTVEAGTVIGLSTRGSAAIVNEYGQIIGALTCGHDLSQSKYVDMVKKQNNCEVTFFSGDQRMSTTLLDEKGNRAVGTKASAEVVEAVLNKKQNYTGKYELFGKQYQAFYSPVIIDGEVAGMIFTGVQIDQVLQMQSRMVVSIITGGVLLAVAVVITIMLIGMISRKTYWYESLLDSIPYPISVTDADMKWTFVNKPVEQMLNATRASLIGKHCSNWGAAICKTSNCGIECLKNGKQTTFFEQMGMDFQVNTSFIYDKNNKKVGHIEVVQDISAMMKQQKAQTQLVSGISDVCGSFMSASENISSGAQALAQGSTQQAASVQQLSASISEVSDKTQQNAKMAQQAAALSDNIKTNAEKGSTQMDSLMNSVTEINEANQSVSKVIKAIDDIAFQTNILALNAAVEAARAGQYGKGFAVVAEEVRNLAAKSAESAKDTGNLIANAIEKSNLGLSIAADTSASLREIVSGINQSAEIIAEIDRSSDEQSAAIAQINIGIEQVSQVVQQNSATAQQSAAASQEMSEQAALLNDMVDRFNREGSQQKLLSENS